MEGSSQQENNAKKRQRSDEEPEVIRSIPHGESIPPFCS